MNLRVIASLAVAIFLGLIAVVLVRNYVVGGRTAGPAGGAGSTPVVVAAAPIARGAALRPAMLKIVNYPQGGVPAGAFQSPSQLGGTRLALREIATNEPIMADKVTGSGATANLSITLTPGMRAVAVRSSDVAGVAGFALPGDRVDILLTRTIGSGDEAVTVTQALAQDVRVLGVDQSVKSDPDKPVVAKAVTVEVTPDQAQSLSLAQSIGAVSLSLRQIADTAALTKSATTVADLGTFGYRPKAAPAAGAPAAKAADAHPKPRLAAGMTEVRVVRGVETSAYPVGTD